VRGGKGCKVGCVGAVGKSKVACEGWDGVCGSRGVRSRKEE
jgi:hypothetical protein